MTGKKVKAVNSIFDHYLFFDDEFSCKIVPGMSGSIQELIVNGAQILEGVTMDEFGLRTYSNRYNAALLFPFPNRIANGQFIHNENTLQLTLNDSNEQHAIHGLVSNCNFELVEFSDNCLELEYRHRDSPGFPFQFNFKVRYEFHQNKVNITFNIFNIGTNIFPFGIGWHPYFKATNEEDFSVEFQPDKHYVMNEDLIPKDAEKVGSREVKLANSELDDAFRLTSGIIEIQDANYSLTMTVPDKSYLQIFTPNERKSVAIEPMTCIGNSFNNGVGLQHLKPNENYEWDVRLDFHQT